MCREEGATFAKIADVSRQVYPHRNHKKQSMISHLLASRGASALFAITCANPSLLTYGGESAPSSPANSPARLDLSGLNKKWASPQKAPCQPMLPGSMGQESPRPDQRQP
jgi:hypothetical protein